MAQRRHLRAPVNDDILYICDDFVLSGRCVNISEGGLLLSELGKVPEERQFEILMPLIQYPEFSKLSSQKVIGIERSSFETEIIRAKVDVVRSFEGMSEVQKILMKSIGTKFVQLGTADKALVQSFVQTFAKNLVFLLTLFESKSAKGVNVVYLRKIADLLGYESTLKLPLLRQKVLHDYQSLESL